MALLQRLLKRRAGLPVLVPLGQGVGAGLRQPEQHGGLLSRFRQREDAPVQQRNRVDGVSRIALGCGVERAEPYVAPLAVLLQPQ
jgi:hypothetical protein